jgi:flagellar protein FlaJ
MVLSFKGLATLLFGNIADKYADKLSIIRDSLPKADIKIAFRTYFSTSLLISIISYVAALITTIAMFQIIKLPLLQMIVYSIFVPFVIAITSFVLLIFMPYQKVTSRRKNIESNLPFVLTHMGAVAESGVPPQIIFKLISQFNEYGEIANEMRKIVRNIDVYGIDPMTAVKEVAQKTPSDSLKQILLGFTSTTESGGDIKVFLKSAGQQALFDWRMKRERFLQQLSAYAEFYTGILIAAPLFIISLFSVLNLVQGTFGGYQILDLMKITIYVLMPVLNGVFLLFLRGVEVEM